MIDTFGHAQYLYTHISSGNCIAGTLRLAVNDIYELYGSDDLTEDYYYKDELSRGRPEICSNGSFSPVCDVSWDLQDASVVCRTLGFSPYGKHGV